MTEVLYLSHTGLMEQLGQSQVLAYLRHLARGRSITLVSYEKSADLDDLERKARFDATVRDAGIRWIPLRYHKRPSFLAKPYDLGRGLAVGAYQCLMRRVRIVHARGYVMAGLALLLKRLFGVRFIFDMRGFYVDQVLEMGFLREGTLRLRIARWIEAQLLRGADVVFALSPEAVAAMRQWPAVAGRPIRFEVVTTCTDLERFTPASEGPRVTPDRPLMVGYAGNAGQGYLFDPVLDTFLAIRRLRPDAKLTIVNRQDHAFIRERLQARNLNGDTVTLRSCDYEQMPGQLRAMDIAMFFYRWGKSHVSSVPTRMGELLACGVICVSNVSGAGIVEILEGEGLGVVMRGFDPESLDRAAAAAIHLAQQDRVRRQCVETARRRFSLEAGVATYERVYRQLESRPAA